MPDTIQMNFQILPETREKIKELAKLTFRGLGDTLDWLVAEKWAEMAEEGPETLDETVEHLR